MRTEHIPGITVGARCDVMKMIMILTSLLIVSLVLNSYCLAEPVEQPKASFNLSFHCGGDSGSSIPRSEECNGLCLVGTLDSGLNVVLLDEKGVCCAKTGKVCTARYPYEADDATQLVGSEKCESANFAVAVVGVDPPDVRLVTQNSDQSPLQGDMLERAAQLTKSVEWESQENSDVHYFISEIPGKVLKAPEATLLVFQRVFKTSDHVWESDGPVVLFLNNRVFLLRGKSCTGHHVFFYVKDKLHLAYEDTCCGCGWWYSLVYDLSGEKPKQVYENGVFSD